MIQDLYDKFKQVFGQEPAIGVRAPGRVNLIGEHTDYNDGFVLPIAIDKQVVMLAAPSDENVISLYSLDYDQLTTFSIDEIAPSDEAKWSNYVRGVGHAMRRHGQPLRGAAIAIAGNVPRGAGLSSSAALEMAAAYTLTLLSQAPVDKVRLALWGQEAENRFVGVQTGIMDQFISALGEEGCALCIDCRNLTFEAVPLGLDAHNATVVVVESGVQRGLVGSEYDTRRLECREGVRILQSLAPGRGIIALRDVTSADLERYGGSLPEIVRKRVRHVVTEDERVLLSVDALRAGDLGKFGELMYESHISMRDDYQITVPAVDHLIDLAHRMPYVLGTRMTGGGFGGSTVHLVRSDALADFGRDVVERYIADTGLNAPMYTCRAVAGVGPLDFRP